MSRNEWDRMTVRDLQRVLQEFIEAGAVGPDTLVFVDSDPEGNDAHPMRQSYGIANTVTMGRRVHLSDEDPDEASFPIPAPAISFGVGY